MDDVLRRASRTAWHPILFAIWFVGDAFSHSGIDLAQGARAFGVAVATVTLLIVALWLILRDWRLAALIATIVLILVTSKPTTGFLAIAIGRAPWPVAVGMIVSLSLIGVLSARIARFWFAPSGRLVSTTRALNLMAVISVASMLFFASQATIRAAHQSVSSEPVQEATVSTNRPDIYVIFLDGYPRADALKEKLGFDNRRFIDGLAARGFDVATQSASNYLTTRRALLSLLHMRPLNEISVTADALRGDDAALHRAIEKNPVFDQLHKIGYTITATAPGIEVASLRSADRFVEGPQVNEFEYRLLEKTFITDALRFLNPDYLSAEQRARINLSFRELEATTFSGTDQPQLVWAHVLSPHMPPVFGRNGEPRHVDYQSDFYADFRGQRAMDDPILRQTYLENLQYLNERVLQAVDETSAKAARPPIIIIWSDHGFGLDLDVDHPVQAGLDQRTRNFFAARTPGKENLFPKTATPVNLFPRIFNAYFGTSYPLHEDVPYVRVGPAGLEEIAH